MPDATDTTGGPERKPGDSAASAPEQKPEGIIARDAALQIPSIVATALLKRPVEIHGITLQAFSFDAVLVLNRIGNLLGRSFTEEELKGISGLDLAQAVFALACPDEAAELAEKPNGADTFTDYDKAALKFLRTHKLASWQLAEIATILGTLYSEGLAAAPGAGASDPQPAGAA